MHASKIAYSDAHLEIEGQGARLQVDVIEAGFPAASPDDFAAVEVVDRDDTFDWVRIGVVAGVADAHVEAFGDGAAFLCGARADAVDEAGHVDTVGHRFLDAAAGRGAASGRP